MRSFFLAAVLAAAPALARDSEDSAALGLSSWGEVGALGASLGANATLPDAPSSDRFSAFLVAARFSAASYFHQTVFGTPGGLVFRIDLGYLSSVSSPTGASSTGGSGRFHYDTDLAGDLMFFATSFGPVRVRLDGIFGCGLWINGPYLVAGGRLAFTLVPGILSVDGGYSLRPGVTYSGVFQSVLQHRVNASLVIEPIHVALGFEAWFGSLKDEAGVAAKDTALGGDYKTFMGTATYRCNVD